MARKGENKKLKRIAAPKAWKIPRKTSTWITKPKPGPHNLEASVPLNVLVRDMLGLAKTTKESKVIIKQGKIKVDGKVRKDLKFPVGFMDTISVPAINKYYRIVYDRLGKLITVEIDRNDANKKLVRVKNKTPVKGGKIQINLHDGRNILLEKTDIKTGDTLMIRVPDQKIEKTIRLEKGALAYIVGGGHTGELAKIEEIMKGTITRPPLVRLTGETEFLTSKENVFAVGKDKPEVGIGDVSWSQ